MGFSGVRSFFQYAEQQAMLRGLLLETFIGGLVLGTLVGRLVLGDVDHGPGQSEG